MKKFFRSLTQNGRKQKKHAKTLNARNRARFDQYEISYRDSAINSTVKGTGNEVPDTITVSLTSYGQRIETVYLTIESLMQQSLQADRIVLCLARDASTPKRLPHTLLRQQERGLEILWCDQDLGPYTKYYYTFKKYPNDLVITADDDLIYPIDTIDSLYRSYLEAPENIHCTRGHKITFAPNGQIKPYKEWTWDHYDPTPSQLLFPTGVGGVLYPPKTLHDDVFNQEAFLKLAPNADDLWLKIMSLLNETKCQQTVSTRPWSERFIQTDGTQTTSLKRKNKSKTIGNDFYFSRLLDHFSLWDQLKDENRSFR